MRQVRGLVPLAALAALIAGGWTSPAPPERPGSGGWEIRASLPIDLYAGAAASDGTYAYVAGGYSFSTNQTLETLFRFDDATNSWTTLALMPTAAIMPSAVYYPPTNKIYVFGGQEGGTGTNYAITRIYDIATDTWTTGADMPDVRSFMASAYYPVDHKIYLIGGYRTGLVSSAQDQVWAYDPATNTFDTTPAPIPHAVGGAGSGLIGPRMYVVGGRTGDGVLSLNWEYNIASNTWSSKAPAPQPTNVPGSGARLGGMYLFGGGNPFVETPFETASSWVYDPSLNTWSAFGPMNVARSFPASTFVGGMAFVAGGFSLYETLDGVETTGAVGPPPPPTCTGGQITIPVDSRTRVATATPATVI